MSLETAKKVIDTEIARFHLCEHIQIEIIGGEPFLPQSFRLFQAVVEYVSCQYPSKSISYIVTTNGTFVHGEVQDFLMKYSDRIYLSLSLDGRKRSHDMNRITHDGRGSFDDIDIAFFQKYPIPVNAKMTVSPITLPFLADDVSYVQDELGLVATTTFATGIKWENEYQYDVLANQLSLLVERYSHHPQLPLPKLLEVELQKVFAVPDATIKPCGAGESTRTFTPNCILDDGSIEWYPCQGLAPISVGDEAKHFKNCMFEGFILDEPCASCKFRGLCPSCQATNYGITGDVTKQSPMMCLLNRLTALASSTIQYNRMTLKDSKQFTSEDQAILKAIQIIQTEILDGEKHNFLCSLN